jgi:hypothetical protein
VTSLTDLEYWGVGAGVGAGVGYLWRGKLGALAGGALGFAIGYIVDGLVGDINFLGKDLGQASQQIAKFMAAYWHPAITPVLQAQSSLVAQVAKTQPLAAVASNTTLVQPGIFQLPTVSGTVTETYAAGDNLGSVLHGAELLSGFGVR